MLNFAVGFLLGLSLAAPPGPTNALTASEAVARGVRQGVRVGMGAVFADMLWLVILMAGVADALSNTSVIRSTAAIGAVVTLVLAYHAWQQEPTDDKRRGGFRAGILVTLASPYSTAWWLSGGFVVLKTHGLTGGVGLLFGVLAWAIMLSILVARGAQKWQWFPTMTRWVSTVLLIGFSTLMAGVALGLVEA